MKTEPPWRMSQVNIRVLGGTAGATARRAVAREVDRMAKDTPNPH